MKNDQTPISTEEVIQQISPIIQQLSLPELKQLILDMQPSGKINDIHAIRLFLLGIITKIEDLEKKLSKDLLSPA